MSIVLDTVRKMRLIPGGIRGLEEVRKSSERTHLEFLLARISIGNDNKSNHNGKISDHHDETKKGGFDQKTLNLMRE